MYFYNRSNDNLFESGSRSFVGTLKVVKTKPLKIVVEMMADNSHMKFIGYRKLRNPVSVSCHLEIASRLHILESASKLHLVTKKKKNAVF